MATNYTVNYDDKRFASVEADKERALTGVDKTYDKMIDQTDKFYQDQIDASKQWAETQKQNQQEQTDFAIEQIEQQKAQAEKDYKKEQSGAYVDWQKQSGEYGANAEAMAAQGMGGTGYSESSQVSMYNTYQNRVATARETYSRAVLNYDNAIKDARLQNNAALAEIAYNALQTQLELALEGFQYKNSLIQEKTKIGLEVDNNYYNRYQDVLQQINTENSLAEEVRQYNESLAEEKRQYNQSYALQQAELAERKRQFNVTQAAKAAKSSGSSSGGGSRKVKSGSSGKKSSSKDNSAYVQKKKDDSAVAKKKSSSKSTVDMKSVTNLGYGPISASTLNKKVQKGEVKEYESNGKIKFKKSAKGITNNMLFSKNRF